MNHMRNFYNYFQLNNPLKMAGEKKVLLLKSIAGAEPMEYRSVKQSIL